MASEVIRSFLVALGFKTDEAALKNFTGGINTATKAVFALATAVETVAVGVAAGVARFASNLEALYFASRRTGSSATQLKALDLAARSLGAHAGEAVEGVEGLAAALRTNPGNLPLLQGLLAKLGLTLKFNADGSVNAADALLKLIQVFKTWPYFQANQFANQLGISEGLLKQLVSGDLLGKYAKALKQMSEAGWEGATEDAHKFMDELRDLEGQFDVFGIEVENALKKKLGYNLQDIKEWLRVNGPWLADRIADVAANIIKAARWIAEHIALVIQTFKEWDSATDGLSTKLLALALVLKVTGAGSLITGVVQLASALGVLSATGLASVGAITALVTAAMSLKHAMSGEDASNFISKWVDENIPEIGLTTDAIYNLFHRGKEKLGISLNNPGNLEFRNQYGAIPGGPGGRWANFFSPGEGLFALGRQLGVDGSRGLNNIGSLITSWAPPSQNNTAAYIADVVKRTGYSASQTLNLQDPAVLANLMNAMIWHEQGKDPYSAGLVSSKAAEAIDYVKGVSHVSQQTTIHVDGTGDPKAVADRVVDQQRKVNQELTRNVAVPSVQ